MSALRRNVERYEVTTASGETLHARSIVVATGANQRPYVPAFGAALSPNIVQSHSSAYRRASDFIGERIRRDGEFLARYDPKVDAAQFESACAHGVHMVRARAGHHLAPVPLTRGGNTFEALGLDTCELIERATGQPDAAA